jgi:hypothetical protein
MTVDQLAESIDYRDSAVAQHLQKARNNAGAADDAARC